SVTLFFDPDDFRTEVADALSDATGRQVEIAGPLELSVFPWLAVQTGGITMSDATAFGPAPMLSLDNASAAVKMAPLFSGKVEVGNVSVVGLDLNLQVRSDGLTNWDDIVETAGADTDVTPTIESDATSEPLELSIESIKLIDANITYRDGSSGSEYALTNVNVSIGNINPATPTDIDGSLEFRVLPDALSGAASVRTSMSLQDDGGVTLEDLRLDGDINTPTFTDAQSFSWRAQQVHVNTTANTLDINSSAFAFANIEGTLSVMGSGPSDPVSLRGAISVAEFDLNALLTATGSEPLVTADPQALARIRFDAEHALTFESMTLQNVRLVVDDTTLSGSAGIANFASGAVVFDLAGDRIDIDRYLAPADPNAAASTSPDAEVAIPVDMLDGLTAAGQITFEELVTASLPLTDVSVGINVADKRARLHPIKASVLGGQYSGDIRVDTRGAAPTLSVNETVSAIQLGSVASTLFERDNIDGVLNANFKLAGAGVAFGEIARTLAGDVEFSIADAALVGTDIWSDIRRGRALFKRETPPPAPANPRTEFTKMTGTLTVADGIASGDDFFAALPFLQLTGRGRINLATAGLDYKLDARVLEVPDFLDSVSAEELAEYTEAVIPLQVEGSMLAPDISPDVEGWIKNKAKSRLDQELGRLLGGDEEADEEEDLEDQLKRRLLDKLRGN
ncbi:MAG: AsmA family protein, partial [Pseudomonadota bacterium]